MTGIVIGVLLIVLCAIMEGLGQVSLKKSVSRRKNWFLWISVGVLILAGEAIFYTLALRYLPVGAAFAISSLNLVAVLALSHLLLKEEVDRTRWIGVLMILAGVSLVIVRI